LTETVFRQYWIGMGKARCSKMKERFPVDI